MQKIASVFGIVIILFVTTSDATAVDSGQWWKDNRAIYASFDLSGVGGPLMKFPSEDTKEKLGTFHKLPVLLQDARRLGCNCVYLVIQRHRNNICVGNLHAQKTLSYSQMCIKAGVNPARKSGLIWSIGLSLREMVRKPRSIGRTLKKVTSLVLDNLIGENYVA